jgi:hypothetical protein
MPHTDIDDAAPLENPVTASRPRITVQQRAVVVGRVCRLVASGLLLKEAVKREGVRRETFWRWLDADEQLRRRFERARVAQAHALAEQAISIADAPVRDHADAVRARTRVDVRKWFVAKLAPKIYGERLQVEQEQRSVVRHVVMLPPRNGPPPAIVAGRMHPPPATEPDPLEVLPAMTKPYVPRRITAGS